MSACLCDPCGREFTGLGPFDHHQDVDYTRRPAVRCMDPASVGLVQNEYGRWGFPVSAAKRATLDKMRARQGSPGVIGYPAGSEAAESSFTP